MMLHQNFKQIKLPNGYFVLPARISPKENSGANGKFLPKPLLFHLRHPNSKTNQPKFWQILSPKNSFAKTSSALVPPPARILGGQNTKEKCPFLFRKNWSRANPKSKEHFSLVSAEALRGGGGTVHSSSGLLSKKVRILYNEYRALKKCCFGSLFSCAEERKVFEYFPCGIRKGSSIFLNFS